jgi:hypothetical protein
VGPSRPRAIGTAFEPSKTSPLVLNAIRHKLRDGLRGAGADGAEALNSWLAASASPGQIRVDSANRVGQLV